MEKVDRAVEYLWLAIEEAKGMLEDEKLSSSEKKAWATVLGNTISILNKIVSSQKGEQKVDKDKIARLISKLPKKYVRIIEKGSGLIFDKQ